MAELVMAEALWNQVCGRRVIVRGPENIEALPSPWPLPKAELMIHLDLNSARIKPESFDTLHKFGKAMTRRDA